MRSMTCPGWSRKLLSTIGVFLPFTIWGSGRRLLDLRRLGPEDYSRRQDLEDIEASLDDTGSFRGMELQMVTEALLAAKLSRGLELPRDEIFGCFERAKRLAKNVRRGAAAFGNPLRSLADRVLVVRRHRPFEFVLR